MRIAKKLTILAFLGAGAGSLAACGDNSQTCGPGTEPDENGVCTPTGSTVDAAQGPDAEDPDAEVDPDADTTPTVNGTLAVFDTQLTDPVIALTPLAAVRGGTVRFSFNDLTDPDRGGTVEFSGGADAPIGKCLITRFDAAHPPSDRLDAGPITVTGTGLLKTLGPCTLQPSLGDPDPYMCISHNQAAATVAAQSLGGGAVAYVLAAPTVDLGMTTPTAVSAAVRGPAGALPANTVQITTTAAHGYQTGQFVTIAGSGTFNTTGSAIQVTGANTFVFSQAGSFEVGATFGTASGATNAITGSALVVNGFTAGPNAPAFNSGASSFPIIAQINANTVLVLNSAAGALAAGTPSQGTAAAYTIINGNSPVPTTANFGAFHDFLTGAVGPATATVRIQKAANDVWGAIDFTADVPGEAPPPVAVTTLARVSNVVTATVAAGHNISVGQRITIAGAVGATTSFNGTFTVSAVTATTFTYAQTAADDAAATPGTYQKSSFALDTGPATGTASQKPDVFPTLTAADLNYSCDNNTPTDATDDTCGDESTSTLKALIISGSATRKSVDGLLPFQMPKEVSGDSEWLEWQCAFLISKSADMPAAAVQKIIDFKPTRIEQQVLFVAGTILDDGVNVGGLKVLTGHALAGHQTFCPNAGAGQAATGFGPVCPACSNGIDDDGAGGADFPADSDCSSAADTTE